MLDLTPIKNRLNRATPGPWRRSYFADKLRYKHWSAAEKQKANETERLTIRGPGVIGTPECNIVLRFLLASDEDIEFIADAYEDITDMVAEIEDLRNQLTESEEYRKELAERTESAESMNNYNANRADDLEVAFTKIKRRLIKNCKHLMPVEGGIPYCPNICAACDGCEHIFKDIN